MIALLQLVVAVVLLAVAAAFWSEAGPDDHVQVLAAFAACLCGALVLLRALMRFMTLARWLVFVPLSAGVVVLSLIGALG